MLQKPIMQSAAPASASAPAPAPAPAPASAVEFLSRKDFGDFVFGAASSAFQYEGAHDRHGKGESIWDTFMRKRHPARVEEEKALDAIFFYDRYEEDIQIIKDIGFDAYRFSISWPRILPKGRWTEGPDGEEQGVNQLGITFYNNLINNLCHNKIEPVVTLFHWDLPQTLEDEYKGFLKKEVVDDFCNFADLCFRKFGDRVKKWITFNETWSYSLGGYLVGTLAPGRGVTSAAQRSAIADNLPSSRIASRRNFANNAGVPQPEDPMKYIYAVTHNQLLAHAAAAKLYKEKYKKHQNGEIGMAIVTNWFVPISDKQEDKKAADRALDFMLGWLLHPLIFGQYPQSMRNIVQERLPHFSDEEAKDLTVSLDFIGLNYYTANYAKNISNHSIFDNPDSKVIYSTEKDGEPIGWKGGSDWLLSYPQGLTDVLLLIKRKYNNPPIYITENGVDELRNDKLSREEFLNDHPRIRYHYEHLSAVKCALSQGATNVKGYFAWSLMDNLEWGSGFDSRFGIYFIHFGENYERLPKSSVNWFKRLLGPNN